MLNGMHPRLQLLHRFALLQIHLTNDDGLAPVDSADDVVHHDAGLLDLPLLEGVPRTLDGILPIEAAGQGWMQIDDIHTIVFQRLQRGFGEDVHPAGADDEVRLLREDDRSEVGIVNCARFVVRWVARLVREEVVIGGGDTGVGGAGQTEGRFAVGNDVDYLARKGGIEKRLEVRAAARDEDQDSLGVLGAGLGVQGLRHETRDQVGSHCGGGGVVE